MTAFTTHSPEETAALGQAVGTCAIAGDVLVLCGDLGAGKTVFAKGVAAGLDIPPDTVQSPTFTIAHTYEGRLPLLHSDLYRLETPAELAAIGFADMIDEATGVCLVEWGDRFPEALPPDALWCTFTAPDSAETPTLAETSTPAENTRVIACRATGPAALRLLANLRERSSSA